jgi:hypothetical protein
MTQLASVEFLETTTNGQVSMGSVVLTEEGLEGDVSFIELLLGEEESIEDLEANPSRIVEVMQDAPRRFDGGYLRAAYVGPAAPFLEAPKHQAGKHNVGYVRFGDYVH